MLINFVDAGISISINDVHSSKANDFIVTREDDSDNSFNLEHPLKANSPISVTEEGITIFSKDVHLSNENELINSTEDGISISISDEQS